MILIVDAVYADKTKDYSKCGNEIDFGFIVFNDFGKCKYRYIEPKSIVNYFRRKQIEQNLGYITKIRANVESTIHQVFYTLKGQKSKYRGQQRNHAYVISRSLWANLRRIIQNAEKKAIITAVFAIFSTQQLINAIKNIIQKPSRIPSQKNQTLV